MIKKYAVGLIFGLVVTALLSLVLVIGVSSTSQLDSVPEYGAINLSSLPYESNEPDKTEFLPNEIASVPNVETIKKTDFLTQALPVDLSVASFDFNFAPEIVGTAILSGVPSPASMGGSVGGGAFTLSDVDELPHPIYAPNPIYPAAMKRLGKEQKVHVQIVIEKDGTVSDAEPLVQTDETILFHQSAIKTIMKWRFSPCKRDGDAVRCVADLPIAFNLDDVKR